jgi:signal recognition particle receptor subunit beta
MVLFNHAQKEVTIKLVFYGPALSGKTTNLQVIHRCLRDESRGRLLTLDTADDRTLFFDVLPVFFKTPSGFKIKLKLFTVPGQVMHSATRRIVLTGADGIIFVADSRRSEARANADAWRGMMENLEANGIDAEETPIVLQFNKRDLPDVRTDDELKELAAKSREPLFKAIAIRGEGVLESLFGLLGMTLERLDAQYDLQERFGVTPREVVNHVAEQLGEKDQNRVNLDDVLGYVTGHGAIADEDDIADDDTVRSGGSDGGAP